MERWLKADLQLTKLGRRISECEGDFNKANQIAEQVWQEMLARIDSTSRTMHYTPMEMHLALGEMQSVFALSFMDYTGMIESKAAPFVQREDGSWTRIVEDSAAMTNLYDINNYKMLRRVDFDRKQVEVVECPVCLRVDIGLEKRVRLVDELFNLVLVEAHKPVRLVEPMLAIELDGVGLREPLILADGHVCTEEHTLHVERSIERSRQVQDLEIAFRRGTDDHLRGLPRRCKGFMLARHTNLMLVGGGLAPHKRPCFGIFGNAVANLTHGLHDALTRFLRREQCEAIARRKLEIDTHSVAQPSELID